MYVMDHIIGVGIDGGKKFGSKEVFVKLAVPNLQKYDRLE